MKVLIASLASLLFLATAEPLRALQPCQPEWLAEAFPVDGVKQYSVNTLARISDGAGETVYVGGIFSHIANTPAFNIARWSGAELKWVPLGQGLSGPVNAITGFDDGAGFQIIAAGEFNHAGGAPASRIARWDSSSGLWSPLGSGISNGNVLALTTFDDGSGPAVYVGGFFTSAGGVSGFGIARWTRAGGWQNIGGISGGGRVNCFAIFDDGSGPALYAAGAFTSVGGVPANHIARWNGASWSAVGDGVPGPVHSLAVFDDGQGNALYAGGNFPSTPQPTSAIHRWDGHSWTALPEAVIAVRSLAVYDDGQGDALYASGFPSAWTSQSSIARWTGSDWSSIGSASYLPPPAMAVLDRGEGPELLVGGNFTGIGGVVASRIAAWNGATWSPIAAGQPSIVNVLTSFDDHLYIGDQLASMYHTQSRWDGEAFQKLNDRVVGSVRALTIFNDGGGPQIYAGGQFSIPSGQSGSNIARYDGQAWSPVGGGISGTVFALAAFDSGAGPNLYAAGSFTLASGIWASRIARLESSGGGGGGGGGEQWVALGTGLNGTVHALATFDGGAGPALYAGGHFTAAGSLPVSHIARWNGQSWSPLGPGLNHNVEALVTFDEGSGMRLVAAGSFTAAGIQPVSRIARWDGAHWSPLGLGIDNTVRALAVFDDGSGEALYAGGWFTLAGDVPAESIARWNGQWSPLGAGLDGGVNALAVLETAYEKALYIGGSFTMAGGMVSSHLARWGCPRAEPCYANCDHSTAPPILNVEDFTCFINSFAAATSLPHEEQITHYANCDRSTTAPALTVDDFTCFINAFASGCP